MPFLICFRIRISGWLQKRQRYAFLIDRVPIFTVIHQTESVICLRDIRPLMRTYLKSGHIPAGILMRSSLHISVLNIIGRFIIKNIHRKMRFQHIVLFFPVYGRHKIHPVQISVKYQILPDIGAVKSVVDPETCFYRSFWNHSDTLNVCHLPAFAVIVNIDIPCVIIVGPVLIAYDPVQCLPGFAKLPPITLVDHRSNTHSGIKAAGKTGRFESVWICNDRILLRSILC